MGMVTGTFTDAGNGTEALMRGPFNVTVWGTFAGTVALERSFDSGVTYVPAAFGDGALAAFSTPVSLVWTEPETGVFYRLRCALCQSGTINWRLSQ